LYETESAHPPEELCARCAKQYGVDTVDPEKVWAFIEYFQALDALGIPSGMSDLRRKATELGLPQPRWVKDEKEGWKPVWADGSPVGDATPKMMERQAP
jgi:hypothetical protein